MRHKALVSQMYDARDPVQRQMLDRLYPEISRSKIAVWRRYQDQNDFLIRMSMAPPGAGGSNAIDRLMRILGGAEQILVHDLHKFLYGAEYSKMSDFATSWFGWISLFRRPDLERADGAEVESTRELRKRVGYTVGHHFPRFFMGRWSWDEATRKRDFAGDDDDAVERLVLACEAICNQDRLMDTVIKRLGAGGGDQQGAFDRFLYRPLAGGGENLAPAPAAEPEEAV